MSVEGTEILDKMNFHENVITNNVVKMNFNNDNSKTGNVSIVKV